jgi:hypothetical protein
MLIWFIIRLTVLYPTTPIKGIYHHLCFEWKADEESKEINKLKETVSEKEAKKNIIMTFLDPFVPRPHLLPDR